VDPVRYPLIPIPREVEPGEGEFLLTPETRVLLAQPQDIETQRIVEAWLGRIREGSGLPLSMGEAEGPSTILIELIETDGEAGEMVPAGAGLPGVDAEGYELEVREGGVALQASGYPGLFYGLETLSQLITQADGGDLNSWVIPVVDIDDIPRFQYRGMHLDVGRHYFPVAFIKRYLDFLAVYKMNVFHWHLTEDQGWRIEIQGYPRLTEVGSCRAETMVEKNFDPYVGDSTEYCGYYTQEEVREVVAYARERFITVIPEIEMPGHSVAALAAYPELACTDGPFDVSTRWGVTQDIYCPKEETFDFLEDVLTEVLELFPSPYIHIGGDEAPKARWEESELAQEVIGREGLADEDELQSWFIRRIENFLNAHGRMLVGWDEILEGGLAPNATVMSWRGMAGGTEAARQGHDVIMTPNSHVYLDYYQGDTIQEPLAIGGFLPLERVYAFEPVPPELSRREARHVLGGQGNVWTEYISTTEYVEYMVLPRLLALSEVVWSPVRARNWSSFLGRLPAHLRRLDAMGVNYRIPDVFGLNGDQITLDEWFRVELSAPIGDGEIHFTLDGSDPGAFFHVYNDPFVIRMDEDGFEMKARVVLHDGREGAIRGTRVRKAEFAHPTSLPGRMRAGGLVARILAGRFSSVDSLPPWAGGDWSTGETTIVPRVRLPDELPTGSFGAVLSGFVRVPRKGIYTFFLSSDDGSSLRIGGRMVVDNDGLHSMSEHQGQVALHRGWHPLEVRYFQGGGGAGVRLEIEGPGLARRQVPAHWFAHSTEGWS
jgi:hexosaminidase